MPSLFSQQPGMRRGEVIGLRWRDVDFDSAEMSVRNSITTAGPGKVVAGPPKTPRSRRQIYLDDATTMALVLEAFRLGYDRSTNFLEDVVELVGLIDGTGHHMSLDR